ncbi:uncharacterized protein LOC115301172 [Suricata suricatta]|uniref:uncharacterized protein LOC115301172 n=1 Tax=Suricata suricatta TaxID=37032 RepID=UPI0011555C01|nr:uncharacterized protein LOC115301172 [Suricata suricatta]
MAVSPFPPRLAPHASRLFSHSAPGSPSPRGSPLHQSTFSGLRECPSHVLRPCDTTSLLADENGFGIDLSDLQKPNFSKSLSTLAVLFLTSNSLFSPLPPDLFCSVERASLRPASCGLAGSAEEPDRRGRRGPRRSSALDQPSFPAAAWHPTPHAVPLHSFLDRVEAAIWNPPRRDLDVRPSTPRLANPSTATGTPCTRPPGTGRTQRLWTRVALCAEGRALPASPCLATCPLTDGHH